MSLYDQHIANLAAATDQCMKLGAVVLKEPKHRAGFNLPAESNIPGGESAILPGAAHNPHKP